MNIRAFEVGAFAVNTYILWNDQTKEAVIVDPSFGSEGVLSFINKEGLSLSFIVNTHGHVDHVAGDAYYKQHTNAQLLIHEADLPLLEDSARDAVRFGMRMDRPPEPERLLVDGDTIPVGGEELTVIHTPGHSPGGICLHVGLDLVVGDTLFFGSIGRTDFPGGSHQLLISSVRTKLFVLPDDTKVYPGHGPATTIGYEKQYNPFFQDSSSSSLWLP